MDPPSLRPLRRGKRVASKQTRLLRVGEVAIESRCVTAYRHGCPSRACGFFTLLDFHSGCEFQRPAQVDNPQQYSGQYSQTRLGEDGK